MDLDNDGIKDLFFGNSNGGLMHYKGKGNLVFDEVGKLQSNGSDFHVSYFAFPEVVDWNEDGLWDLLVHGKHNWDNATNLILFINEGTKEQYVFGKEKQSKDEGGTGFPYIEPRVVPTVTDLDYDGKKDIILGAANGELHFYSNVGTNNAPEYDFNNKVVIQNDGGSYWTENLPEVKPDFADINGDGLLDVVTGGNGGKGGATEPGIYISYGYGSVENKEKKIVAVKHGISNNFKINYSNGKCLISNESTKMSTFSIFDLSGATVIGEQKLAAKRSVSISRLTVGKFYIAKIFSQGNTISKKLILIR